MLLVLIQLLSQGAFGYLLPITSFILVWIETWLLDFKVLPQEAIDENSTPTLLNYTSVHTISAVHFLKICFYRFVLLTMHINNCTSV